MVCNDASTSEFSVGNSVDNCGDSSDFEGSVNGKGDVDTVVTVVVDGGGGEAAWRWEHIPRALE